MTHNIVYILLIINALTALEGTAKYPYKLLGELAYDAYRQKLLSSRQLANILSHLYLSKYNPYNRKFGLPMKVIHFSDSIEIHGCE